MPRDAHSRIRAVAAHQHLVFTRGQVLDAGLSAKTVDRYLRSGRWIRLHAGVYVAADTPITWRQRLAAALLACGPTAVASYRSAATVWEWGDDLFVPEVTVPAGTRRTHPGVMVHRCDTLDAMHRGGFRVTSAMRTIMDLASCVDELRLAKIVDLAHREQHIHPARLTEYLRLPANLTRPGTASLRQIVSARSGGANDSELETEFFEALRRCRVPLPEAQHSVTTPSGQKYIDYAYPAARVAIELDSWEHHGTRSAFERDRPRGNELERLGWHIYHFTSRAVRGDPVGVAVDVARAIGLTPCKWR